MNEDCSKQSCDVPKNAVQDYLNQYSLNQVVVTNSEIVSIINGVSVTIPAGTFKYPISQSTGALGPLTFQGCQSLISVPVPSGSSPAAIQALVQQMLNAAAQQQAQCNAANSGGQSPPIFLNRQVSVASACTSEQPLTISASLPPGITQSGNNLVFAAGVFSSNVSQEDADTLAANYLLNFMNQLFSDGTAVCQPPNRFYPVFWTDAVVASNSGKLVGISLSDYQTLKMLDTSTWTETSVFTAANSYNGNGTYASSTNHFYVTKTFTKIAVVNLSGVIVTEIDIAAYGTFNGFTGFQMAYSATQDRVYVPLCDGSGFAGQFCHKIAVINPNDFSIVVYDVSALLLSGGANFGVRYLFCSNNYLYFGESNYPTNGRIHQLNYSDLSQHALITAPSGGISGAIKHAPNTNGAYFLCEINRKTIFIKDSDASYNVVGDWPIAVPLYRYPIYHDGFFYETGGFGNSVIYRMDASTGAVITINYPTVGFDAYDFDVDGNTLIIPGTNGPDVGLNTYAV